MDTIRLADLPLEPDQAAGDPGTDWHPRADKPGVRDDAGNLVDLDDDQVEEHLVKPEAIAQLDGGRTPAPAAEDSAHSEPGTV